MDYHLLVSSAGKSRILDLSSDSCSEKRMVHTEIALPQPPYAAYAVRYGTRVPVPGTRVPATHRRAPRTRARDSTGQFLTKFATLVWSPAALR